MCEYPCHLYLPVDDHHQQQHSLHSASQPVLQSLNATTTTTSSTRSGGGNNGKHLAVPGKVPGKNNPTYLQARTQTHTPGQTHADPNYTFPTMRNREIQNSIKFFFRTLNVVLVVTLHLRVFLCRNSHSSNNPAQKKVLQVSLDYRATKQ